MTLNGRLNSIRRYWVLEIVKLSFVSHTALKHSRYMREAQVYATPLAAVVAHILAVHRQRTWRP